MLVEADHAGFTQLTHHHFFSIFRFTDVLHSKICTRYLDRVSVCALDIKHANILRWCPCTVLSLSDIYMVDLYKSKAETYNLWHNEDHIRTAKTFASKASEELISYFMSD